MTVIQTEKDRWYWICIQMRSLIQFGIVLTNLACLNWRSMLQRIILAFLTSIRSSYQLCILCILLCTSFKWKAREGSDHVSILCPWSMMCLGFFMDQWTRTYKNPWTHSRHKLKISGYKSFCEIIRRELSVITYHKKIKRTFWNFYFER